VLVPLSSIASRLATFPFPSSPSSSSTVCDGRRLGVTEEMRPDGACAGLYPPPNPSESRGRRSAGPTLTDRGWAGEAPESDTRPVA
jgi:hypothetical protein